MKLEIEKNIHTPQEEEYLKMMKQAFEAREVIAVSGDFIITDYEINRSGLIDTFTLTLTSVGAANLSFDVVTKERKSILV